MDSNYVVLDSLDGSGFETLCAEVYRRLGYQVENVQDSGDEGRDLILRNSDGQVTVAECKHWPRGTVGRPVVQKLHSAVISFPAKRGAVLTTGVFARSARDYIRKLDVTIDLVDISGLKDMAAAVGITLVTAKDPVPVLVFPMSEMPVLKKQLDGQLFDTFVSNPSGAGSLFSVTSRSIQLEPAYSVRYSVKQDFRTTAGMIHTLDVPHAVLLLDGEGGKDLGQEMASFLVRAPVLPYAETVSAIGIASRRGFVLSVTEAIDVARRIIINLHSTTVRYRGRNNRVYTLRCVPSSKNVFVRDVRQVYVPKQRVSLQALKREYDLAFLENGATFRWLQPPSVLLCQVCSGQFRRGLLCNTCGATAHRPRLLWPHSFTCKWCKRTICKRCAYWVRRWVLFKTVLCEECASGREGQARRLTASETQRAL